MATKVSCLTAQRAPLAVTLACASSDRWYVLRWWAALRRVSRGSASAGPHLAVTVRRCNPAGSGVELLRVEIVLGYTSGQC